MVLLSCGIYLDKKKQPVPSPHPLSILNLTTATLFIIIFLTPNYTDSRLQLIQNSLARIVFNTPKTCHITTLLASLHCLKIKKRIEYKLLSLTYKILTTSQQATYLHNLVSVQSPRGLAAPIRHLSPHCPDQNHEMHEIW